METTINQTSRHSTLQPFAQVPQRQEAAQFQPIELPPAANNWPITHNSLRTVTSMPSRALNKIVPLSAEVTAQRIAISMQRHSISATLSNNNDAIATTPNLRRFKIKLLRTPPDQPNLPRTVVRFEKIDRDTNFSIHRAVSAIKNDIDRREIMNANNQPDMLNRENRHQIIRENIQFQGPMLDSLGNLGPQIFGGAILHVIGGNALVINMESQQINFDDIKNQLNNPSNAIKDSALLKLEKLLTQSTLLGNNNIQFSHALFSDQVIWQIVSTEILAGHENTARNTYHQATNDQATDDPNSTSTLVNNEPYNSYHHAALKIVATSITRLLASGAQLNEIVALYPEIAQPAFLNTLLDSLDNCAARPHNANHAAIILSELLIHPAISKYCYENNILEILPAAATISVRTHASLNQALIDLNDNLQVKHHALKNDVLQKLKGQLQGLTLTKLSSHLLEHCIFDNAYQNGSLEFIANEILQKPEVTYILSDRLNQILMTLINQNVEHSLFKNTDVQALLNDLTLLDEALQTAVKFVSQHDLIAIKSFEQIRESIKILANQISTLPSR